MTNQTSKHNSIESKIRVDQIKHVFRPFMAMVIANTIMSIALLLIYLPHVLRIGAYSDPT